MESAMAQVIDFTAAQERRDAQVRLLTDVILLKLSGVDIAIHLERLAGMELFSEFVEVA
jgi:hypothetical protein